MKTQVFEKDVVGKTIEGISTEDHGVVISFTDGTFLLGVGNCYEGVNFEEVFNAEQDACQQFVDVGIMTQEEYSEIVSQRKVAEQARRDAYEKRLTQQRMDNMENMRRVLWVVGHCFSFQISGTLVYNNFGTVVTSVVQKLLDVTSWSMLGFITKTSPFLTSSFSIRAKTAEQAAASDGEKLLIRRKHFRHSPRLEWFHVSQCWQRFIMALAFHLRPRMDFLR